MVAFDVTAQDIVLLLAGIIPTAFISYFLYHIGPRDLQPSALTVLRLRANSNRVDCMTGISVGLAPLRIWPTYAPAWRYIQVMLGP